VSTLCSGELKSKAYSDKTFIYFEKGGYARNSNKRAQIALGRSPEEKVKGQGKAIILLKPNIGRTLLDETTCIYQI